ncbi:serine/arginine repetitive matrix protein 1-like isoform X1 [Triticum urartu]|uniref:serine/arginine repetitive matrix protein 1-like isoform X1 n=1 Tax=Triticum urartu TaxID=4572 RepID=UPI0020430A54|nr:serine/arginine repetitive matrix protein 1-like isoform X1 [Triticum urartu]XP_048572737.1 serine/arginine repetitive matrix protein 1-like isoform X1 [Triticum urartu]
MAAPPPLVPTPPASLNLRGADAAAGPRAPKLHRPLEPPRPAAQGGLHRHASQSLYSASRRQELNPPPSSRNRSQAPPSKVVPRSRSPPSTPITERLAEPQCAKRPRRGEPDAAEAAVDGRDEGEKAVSMLSSADGSSVENRPSRSHCKQPETSSAAVEQRPDPAIPGDEQKLGSEKMDAKARTDHKEGPSRSARRKKMKRQLKLRGADAAVESCATKLHGSLEPPQLSGSLHRHVSLCSTSRRQEPNPPPCSRRRAEKSPPPKSKIRPRARSPPITQLLAEQPHAKRPRQGEADTAVEGKEEGEKAVSMLSSVDGPSLENRPSYSNCNCEQLETLSAAVEERPDPAIPGDEQKLDSGRRDAKTQTDHKDGPSRSARRKKMKRRIRAGSEKELREMKKDKLLENIKKLQACIWLLEKEGADTAEIMEFRSLLESTKMQYAQYVENETQLAKEGSSASSPQALNKDRPEKMHVETPIEKVERDEQNLDSGKAEGSSLKGFKAVSKQNELAEEVNFLKIELEAVKQDRDYQLAQVQSLTADVAKQKEVARRCGAELENAMRRVAALEEGGLLQRETIRTLQIQLASANEKLTGLPSSTKD